MLVTIGGHAGSGRKIGDVDFGPASEFEEDDATLDWYDYLFKKAGNRFAAKPVRIFVMGANQWRDEEDWPLSRARETKYFLHSAGKANSVSGDGTLTNATPRSESADHYTYDPANPAPTIGGPCAADSQHLKPGPRDQRAVEARDDVLVYSTAALAQNLEGDWARPGWSSSQVLQRLTLISPQSWSMFGPTASRKTSQKVSFAAATVILKSSLP